MIESFLIYYRNMVDMFLRFTKTVRWGIFGLVIVFVKTKYLTIRNNVVLDCN